MQTRRTNTHPIFSVYSFDGLNWHVFKGAKEGADIAQCQNSPYRVILNAQDELYHLVLGDDLNDLQELGLYPTIGHAMQAAAKHNSDATRTTGLLTWKPQHDDPFDCISRAGVWNIEAKGKEFQLCQGVQVLARYTTLEEAQDRGEGMAQAEASRDRIKDHAQQLLEALEAARKQLKEYTFDCDTEGQKVLRKIESTLQLVQGA
ncbi:MAG: hypothetical protein JWQ03_3214 [Variovorax sp.]|nr:hypothetical protein [Variovorax sp.]